MADEGDDHAVEELLARYRPAAPDEAFRERVLAVVAVPAEPAASVRPPIVELAAGLLIAASLHFMAADTEKRTADLHSRVRPGAEVQAALLEAGLPPAYVAWSLTPLPESVGPPTVESES